MIEILIIEENIILKYSNYDYFPNDWINSNLEKRISFRIKKVFNVSYINQINKDNSEELEYYFIIGKLEDKYFQIDKLVFELKNDFYFHKDIALDKKHFIAETNISILKHIDQHISKPIYIGGEKEDTLPYNAFLELIEAFPNTYEVKLYRQAKVTSVLEDYFDDIQDKKSSYHSYVSKKTPVYKSKLRKTFKESEIFKYETIFEKLNAMLNSENNFTEKQWQEEIIQIILLLFPKYIAVFEEVTFKDIYNNKIRRLDYGLIDFNGNLDIVEIKIPFNETIVSVSPYRDNHIPKRDLSGAIMQVEKYVYYLNKTGTSGEKALTKKYSDKLPKEMEVKITNPSGMIIMGRDTGLTKEQLADFEIIKRKYKNIIDIFTYDDLLRRLKVIIEQLKRV